MYTFEAHFTPVRMNCQILRFFDADSPILGFFAVGFCNKSRGFSTKMTIWDEPKSQDVIGYRFVKGPMSIKLTLRCVWLCK